MPNNRMNKSIAGYHLLMILSVIDFETSAREDEIIQEYISYEFPFFVNLDKEMEKISNLKSDEWEKHFIKVMNDYYDDATEAERNNIIRIAIKLAIADGIISKEENYFLNLLIEYMERKR